MQQAHIYTANNNKTFCRVTKETWMPRSFNYNLNETINCKSKPNLSQVEGLRPYPIELNAIIKCYCKY